MSGLDEAQELAGHEEALVDLPLRDAPEVFSLPLASAEAARETAPECVAPLASRWTAFAADAAVVLLLVTAAILGATAARGQGPRLWGLLWAAAFAADLSFFATVFPLILFGRTVGMALAGLSARESGAGRRLNLAESCRRWLGTLVTAVTLGLPLLFDRLNRRNPEAGTLADRLSGRPLVRDQSRVEI